MYQRKAQIPQKRIVMITNCISATAMILLTNHLLSTSFKAMPSKNRIYICFTFRAVLGVMLSTAGIDIPGLAVLFHCRAVVCAWYRDQKGHLSHGIVIFHGQTHPAWYMPTANCTVVSKRQSKSLENSC